MSKRKRNCVFQTKMTAGQNVKELRKRTLHVKLDQILQTLYSDFKYLLIYLQWNFELLRQKEFSDILQHYRTKPSVSDTKKKWFNSKLNGNN